MSLRITSLASGSSGNALLLDAGTTLLLIDAGLPLRSLERHIHVAGRAPGELTAILLTHEHGDHAQSALAFARRYHVPIIANQPTLNALGTLSAGVEGRPLPIGMPQQLGSVEVLSFPVPHDAVAPVGYRLCAAGWCAGLAIDLGAWNDQIAEALTPADLIVIEANHDRDTLQHAPYVAELKSRISSAQGHLENVEAGRLLARIGADGKRRTAWLAHLSEQSNSPEIAERVVRGVLALANVPNIQVHALPRRTYAGQRLITWDSADQLQQRDLFFL